jgi:hypothetical protein
MAQQLKKKFIKSDAVDGSKLKLLKDQAIRGEDQSGQEVELLKLDQSGKLVSQGSEIAFKSQLDSEEAARIAGDSALDERLVVAEEDVVALYDAVDNHQAQINDLDAREQNHYVESSDRLNVVEGDVSGLQLRIETEENFRSHQDEVIQANIDAEIERAEAAESDLQSQIEGEQSRAQGAEMQLSSDLSVETQARISGDVSTLADSKSYTDGKIALVMSNLDTEALDSLVEVVAAFEAADSNLNAAISALGTGSSSGLAAEIARAQGEEARIEGKVDDERTRAMGVEAGLQSSLNSEISNRESAVSAEASARSSADSALQSSLNTEISNRQSAVSAEETARIAGDAALQVSIDDVDGYAQDIRNDLDQELLDRASAISTEEAARIAGDNSLQASLNSEISRAQSAESTLTSSINAEQSRAMGVESGLNSRISVLEQDPTTKTYVDGKVTMIEGQISNIISNVDPAALDSLTEIVEAFQTADSNMNNAISALGTSSSSALAAEVIRATEEEARIEGLVSDEESRAMGVESGLDSRIQVLEAQVDGPFFEDEMFEMSSASQMEYVELSQEAIEKSMVVCVGHLMLHRNFHYTVSVEGGKTKITFINDFASGGVEEMDSTDIVFVKYAYEM